jgi:hypothetical protein
MPRRNPFSNTTYSYAATSWTNTLSLDQHLEEHPARIIGADG